MDRIKESNLIYEVGMVMNLSEKKIQLMIIRNDITSSCLPFTNDVSMRFSERIAISLMLATI